MKNHTVKAVCSLPDEVFIGADAGTVTLLLLIEAHKPHNSSFKTYLGYWKDDGFERSKFGRRDTGRWKKIKENWIKSFKNNEENKIFDPNNKDEVFSVKINLKPEDEWCAEKYLQTNYSLVHKKDFEQTIKDYFLHLLNRPE